MRWKTYRRYEERFDRHEEQLNAGLEKLAAKLKHNSKASREMGLLFFCGSAAALIGVISQPDIISISGALI
jgi:hypothetical protein